MGRFLFFAGVFLLCFGSFQGAGSAQETATPVPFPPEIRAPTEAEQRQLNNAWTLIGSFDSSAFPPNTIDAIEKIRPLVAKTFGRTHPLWLRLDTLEANSLAKDGKHAEAEAIFAGNTEALDRRLGLDAQFAYEAREMRASNLVQLGRLADAAAIYEANARLTDAIPDANQSARARLGVGLSYLRRMQGRFEEAEKLARAAMDAERGGDVQHPSSEAATVAALGRALTGLGRIEEAITLMEGDLAAHPGNDIGRARLLFSLAEAYREAGRLVDAQAFLRNAALLLLEVEGYNSPNMAQATAKMRALTIDLLGASPAIITSALQDGLPILYQTRTCDVQVASLSEAEITINTALGMYDGEKRRDCFARVRHFLEPGMGRDAPLTLEIRERLVGAIESIGDTEPALEEARSLFADRERINGPNHPATARAALLYARTLAGMGRVEDAKALEARAVSVLPAEAYTLEAERLDSTGSHQQAATAWTLAEGAYETGPKQSVDLAIRIFSGRVFNSLYQGECANSLRKDLSELVASTGFLLMGDVKRPAEEAHAILLGCEGKWDEAADIYARLSFESVSDGISFQDANLARLEARRALALMGGPKLYDMVNFAAGNAVFYARERRYTPDRDAAGKPLGYRRGSAAAGNDPLAITFAALMAVQWNYQGRKIEVVGVETTHEGMDAAFRAAQDFAQSSAAASLLEAAARAAVTDPELAALLDRQIAIAAQIAESERNSGNEALETNRKALADLTTELRQRFPAYANTARPFGLSVAETRERLKPGEAVLFIQPVGESVYSFAVSRQTFAWNRAAIDRAEMDRLVQLVRCRVDLDSCKLEIEGEHLFEGQAAASLYRELIAPVERGFGSAQTLFSVTGGSLGNIPLGVLVVGAAPEQSDDHDAELAGLASTKWLADTYALATLPSVSSLRAYGTAREQLAARPFVGIGDPVLGPPKEAARGGSLAKNGNVRGGNGLADRTALKAMYSLPGTRRELITIARSLGTPEDQLLLADAARETSVKSSQAIASAGIIAFATHAMLPGELEGNAEPGLVLTPPETPTAEDDGYLTASEAAALKLHAEWVLLSACNTAGPADGGAGESLSGLARAFFFAGARSLLVSHWPVLDTVGAAITSETFRIAAARPEISRAEALRLSLRGIRSGTSVLGDPIEGWKPGWADPWAWAPFSLVETGS